MNQYDENKLLKDVIQNITGWLDGIYTKQFDHRIRSRCAQSYIELALTHLLTS